MGVLFHARPLGPKACETEAQPLLVGLLLFRLIRKARGRAREMPPQPNKYQIRINFDKLSPPIVPGCVMLPTGVELLRRKLSTTTTTIKTWVSNLNNNIMHVSTPSICRRCCLHRLPSYHLLSAVLGEYCFAKLCVLDFF